MEVQVASTRFKRESGIVVVAVLICAGACSPSQGTATGSGGSAAVGGAGTGGSGTGGTGTGGTGTGGTGAIGGTSGVGRPIHGWSG
jgi:hypothetical protein